MRSDDAWVWAVGAVFAGLLIMAVIAAPAVVFLLGALFMIGAFALAFYAISDSGRYERAKDLYDRFRNHR